MTEDQATAKIKYLRISARKMRPIIDLVRGKQASQAERILSLLPHKAAKMAKAALASAIANAKAKNLNSDELIISSIMADAGPPFKRFMPWSKGVARPILKKTSHLTIVLTKKENISDKRITSKAKKIIKKVVKRSPQKKRGKKEKSSGSKSKPDRAKIKDK